MENTKQLFSGLKEGQKLFGETLASLVNSILLTFVYIIGVGLTSITSKIFKKKFLKLQPDNSSTYWEELNLSKKPMEEYYRQF